MDQINGWPKQLLCLCAMMGSCRELFGHFVLMSEVSSAVVSYILPLNDAHSSSVYLFLFLLVCFSFFSFALCSHFIIVSFFFVSLFLWTFICYRYPSFWSAISRSDPFVGNHCIFNPDLDNGTVTVIFAPGLFAALRTFMSLTLCIPPPLLPLIATLTNAEQCYNISTISSTSNSNFRSQNLFHKLCSPYLSIESVIY